MHGNTLLRDAGLIWCRLAVITAVMWSAPEFARTAAGEQCATIVPPEQLRWEQARRAMRGARTPVEVADPTCPWFVPVFVHLVRMDDGSEGLSLDVLAMSLAQADSLLGEYGARIVQYGGIDYIDNSNYAYLDGCGEDESLRQVNSVGEVINVYFVHEFAEKRCVPLDASTIGECCEGGLDCPEGWACLLDADHNCGRSTFSHSDNTAGIIMDNDCATNGTTLAHEIGHFFDLYHTHGNSGGTAECPDGSNCDLAGDLVCDTPADPNLSGHTVDCVYDDYADPPAGCDNTPYNPDPSNVMSYAPKECRNMFTAGQITRFFDTWEMSRTDLFGHTWYISTAAGAEEDGTPLLPFDLVGDATGAAQAGDHLFIKSGDYLEELLISTPLIVRRWDTTGSVLISSN